MSSKNGYEQGQRQEEPPMYPEKQLDVSDQIDRDRLRAISESRRRVREVRHETAIQRMTTNTTVQQADLVFREAVMSLLLEIKQYQSVDETAQAYWDGVEDGLLGTVTINPPNSEEFNGREPEEVVIKGLNDILTAPMFFERTFKTTVQRRHGPSDTVTEVVRQPIPRRVLDRATEWAATYLHHIGLDLKIEQTVDDEAEPY